ncbi:MAG TPA: LON peptidase substrate-binding domain-containing protein, partial [Desulfotignum sp.]|nr:LON peptidase substrate-binding domain-containing protein [Desulfotignum sp.]
MDDIRRPPAAAISTNDIPGKIPILPIVDTNLFPKMVLPLVLIQKEAIDLIDEAMAGSRMLGLLLSRRSDLDSRHTADDLFRVGTVAMILKMSKMADEKAQLLIQGLNRFKVTRFLQGKPYLQAEIEVITCKNADRSMENRALMANIAEQYEKIVNLSPGLPAEMAHMIKSLQEPDVLADMVASTINAPVKEKQKVLELINMNQRLKKVTRLVNDQLEIL